MNGRISSKISGENLYNRWKKLTLKLSKNLIENSAKQPNINRIQKLVVGDNSAGNPAVCRPVGRPPTVRFSTVGKSDRPDGRPILGIDLTVDRPVDRGRSREQGSLDGRPCGRPALAVHVCAHRSTARSTDFWLGRPAEGHVSRSTGRRPCHSI